MGLGIYIHIPFCRTKCNYCHFVIRPWKAATADRYRKALVREIGQFFARGQWTEEVDSIYFGGGTPSLVPVEDIYEILATCKGSLPVSRDCEISLESNPGTLSADKVNSYNQMGINRVSIGAQSFDDDELASLGRDHTGDQVTESVGLLRQCRIENVNLDLMLGLPGQTEECWSRDMTSLAAIAPPHISLYMLDLHERSPLFHQVAKGRCTIPGDDLIADMYLCALTRFADCGYEQYEISNFAQAGYQCRHNLKYWLREPVLGFGVGSHSYDGRRRYANFRSMDAYLETVERGEEPVEWREDVKAPRAFEEMMFLGLRLNRGLDWQRVSREYDSRQLEKFESSLREMTEEGLLEWQDSVIRLTPRGMLLSNEVFQKFV